MKQAACGRHFAKFTRMEMQSVVAANTRDHEMLDELSRGSLPRRRSTFVARIMKMR